MSCCHRHSHNLIIQVLNFKAVIKHNQFCQNPWYTLYDKYSKRIHKCQVATDRTEEREAKNYCLFDTFLDGLLDRLLLRGRYFLVQSFKGILWPSPLLTPNQGGHLTLIKLWTYNFLGTFWIFLISMKILPFWHVLTFWNLFRAFWLKLNLYIGYINFWGLRLFEIFFSFGNPAPHPTLLFTLCNKTHVPEEETTAAATSTTTTTNRRISFRPK